MAKRRPPDTMTEYDGDVVSPARSGDEPALYDDEDWIEWGGEMIWAMDFTSGGAPIGLTERDAHQINAELGAGRGWARAKALLAWAFSACSTPGAHVEVGRVRKVGEGFSRKTYAAHVDVSPDPDRLAGVWAVLLPGRQASAEDGRRWVRELWALGQLARLQLPFRVPAALGAFPEGDLPVIIRRFMAGAPMDLRAGRMPGVRPAELIGQIAAAVHTIDVSDWPRRPAGGATRRAHGEEMLRSFDDLPGPEVQPAREWAVEHLPADRPAALVHGDLLGQNILLHPNEEPALIDWEYYRMGDPAYDLAIVTRGIRRPFQMDRGLERLLEAYAAASGDPIAPSEVHFHEICLSASWYRASLDGNASEPPDQALARIHRVLRRAEQTAH